MLLSFRNDIGYNTYNYRQNFGYEYDPLTFDGMTPQEFFDEQSALDYSLNEEGARKGHCHKQKSALYSYICHKDDGSAVKYFVKKRGKL